MLELVEFGSFVDVVECDKVNKPAPLKFSGVHVTISKVNNGMWSFLSWLFVFDDCLKSVPLMASEPV